MQLTVLKLDCFDAIKWNNFILYNEPKTDPWDVNLLPHLSIDIVFYFVQKCNWRIIVGCLKKHILDNKGSVYITL